MRFILLACLLCACGDKQIMPKNVRVSIIELTAALNESDLRRICSVMPLVKASVSAWEKKEQAGTKIPGVTSRRIQSLSIEAQQLSDWADDCLNDRLVPKTVVRWKRLWVASVTNLNLLGRVPGHQRTAGWLFSVGISIIILLLLGFAVAFHLRNRNTTLPRKYDDDDD